MVNFQKFVPQRAYWPKIAMFAFAILLPSIAIGISNGQVFARALPIATICLIVTVGVSAVVTYFSGNAAPWTRRFAIGQDVVIAVILCVNFLFHFQIAREIAAAEESQKARKEERREIEESRDRETQREIAAAEARTKELQAQAQYVDGQRKLAIHLPYDQRRFTPPPTMEQQSREAIDAPKAGALPSFSTASPQAKDDGEHAVVKSPEQIKADWFGWLFWAAAAEIFAAVLGGMLLIGVWQWDVNGDGIPDEQQVQPIPQGPQRPQPLGFATPAPQPSNQAAPGQNFTVGPK